MKCFCRFPVAVARSSGDVELRYIFPVLWMTSRLAVMGRMPLWLYCAAISRQLRAIPGRSLMCINAC